MKEPPPDLIAALERGETIPCMNHFPRPDEAPSLGLEPVKPAGFYCAQCAATLCGWCTPGGACITCRAVVRSLGAILLLAKENHT